MLRIVAIALLSFAAALITAAQEKTDASADKSMILALESPRIKRKFTPTPARQRPSSPIPLSPSIIMASF